MRETRLRVIAACAVLAGCSAPGKPPPAPAPVPVVQAPLAPIPGTVVATNPPSAPTKEPSAPVVHPLGRPLADGIYAGYFGAPGGSSNKAGCPPERHGTFAIGDNTLYLATDEDTTFVLPLPPDGPLHAVAGQTTLDGVREPDGRIAFTTTGPHCKLNFVVRYLPGY